MTVMAEMQLEDYTLDVKLNQDEWFTLYQGYRKSDMAPVLIKVVTPLLATDEFFVRRFKQITQQTAGLEHLHIIRTSEAEQEGDLLYVVQDFVEARPLAQLIEVEGPFSPKRMQFIAGQISSALDYAHQKSVMHGDLSTHQIYVGAKDHVWVANFGQVQAIFGTNLAKQGYTGSTFETLAPERAKGQGPSRQADLYSLGILCYQMLAKSPPFRGPQSMVLHAQAYKQPRPLYRINPAVPIAMSEAIGRMLSKGVELRYNTGAEFVRALSVAGHRKKPARPYESLIPLTERKQRRLVTDNSILYFGCGTVIVLFIAILSIWAGYELGLNHSVEQGTPTRHVVVSTSPTLPDPYDIRTAPELTPQTFVFSSSHTFESLSDTLLPTRKPPVETRQPTVRPTSTSTPGPPVSVATSESVAAPSASGLHIPAGQGMLIFYNPTGHDLIIDLTGPTSTSTLVPPGDRQEFLLALGHYQYILHTPTGNWLASKMGTFNLTEGQVVEKDYYSHHDLTLE